MKQQSIALTFIPWIVLSCSSGKADFLTGAIIALALNIVIARKMLLRGVVLELGGTIFFAAMIFVGLLGQSTNIFIQHPNLCSNLAMAIIMLGSVAINKPFTGQYTNKGSKKLHMHLSSIWGILLLLAAFISLGHVYLGINDTVATIGTVAAIILGIKANELYPKWFYERQGHN